MISYGEQIVLFSILISHPEQLIISSGLYFRLRSEAGHGTPFSCLFPMFLRCPKTGLVSLDPEDPQCML